MSPHNNDPVHLEHGLPESQTHIYSHVHPHTNTNTHTHTRASPSCTNNEFSSSEWLSRRNWSHIVSFKVGNWALCPLRTVLSCLLHFSPSLSFPFFHSTLHTQRHATLSFSIKPVTLHHFISVSISETASWCWSIAVILFVSHLCPVLQPPPPSSSWALFPGLRLSHSQNGGKAQSADSPQAVCKKHPRSFFLELHSSFSIYQPFALFFLSRILPIQCSGVLQPIARR